jgi:hypothetical protein
MKDIRLSALCTAILLWFITGTTFGQHAQRRLQGNGNITKVTQTFLAFNKIDAGATDNVIILTQGNNPYSVVTETDENLQNTIRVYVEKKVLHFAYSNIRPTRLRFYVTVPTLNAVRVSGASVVKAADTLRGEQFTLTASGAANVSLPLHFKSVKANASGATDVTLAGRTTFLYATASGAANLKAAQIAADSVYAKATGASYIRVNALRFLSKSASTAATIRLVHSSAKVIQVSHHSQPSRVIVYGNPSVGSHWNDTTRINVGSIHLEVVDGDTTKVQLGSHALVVDDKGDVKWKRVKPAKFNGHWGGVDIGINGYFTPSFTTEFGKEYAFLSQQYEKSLDVSLNLYEQNIAFNKAKTIGMITGLGFDFNDYRFSRPVYLSPDSSRIKGFYMQNVSVAKSKLSLFSLTVPVIFEFQTNNTRRNHRFFVGVGALIHARLRTHTKIFFNDANKRYTLEEVATGQTLPGYYTTPNRSGRNIVKNINSFHLQPFRFDATIRMGYGILSLYATYALNRMFLKNQGPDLHQWAVGISISGW